LSGVAIFVLGVLTGSGALWLVRRREVSGGTPEEGRDPSREPPVAEPDSRRWRPPYVSGEPLREWAASVGRGVVRDATADGVVAGTAARIADELSPAMRQALLPEADPAERGRPVACPPRGQGTIGVTPPEAIALADWLRAKLTPEELQELIEDVTLCDEWIGNGATMSPCALQGDDQICMAYEAQPFACRPTLSTLLAAQLREESGVPESVRGFTDAHAETVAHGMRDGLREGLERAGLDATTYELHSALRRALSRPDAAEAWARGEDLFERCRIVGAGGARPAAGLLQIRPTPTVPPPTAVRPTR